ncbi:uncharacterized protein LOC128678476 [Plodia interpunctella]|uniref:uncharacterized protein LOC128678476 n=1 Tax=Plodia interpunctella TaxID=58824 RepID=UPI002367B102|nr:uncharacterized protein LOC128678476 [Plodia interpunctella]
MEMEESPRKKMKYIPQSEVETQCDDDDVFYENSQTYDDSEPIANNVSGTIKKTTKDCATCTEKIKDNSTSLPSTSTKKTREEIDERQIPTIIDLHGCKYFGQFVSNELLRFSINERYAIMQNIIEILK